MINGLKLPLPLVVQSLIKSTSSKQLSVLMNAFHRKIACANVSYNFTYLYSMFQEILIYCSKYILQKQNLISYSLVIWTRNSNQQDLHYNLWKQRLLSKIMSLFMPSKHVKLTPSVLPEPQNDPYSLMKW